MMVQSPLKRREVKPNLRKTHKPDITLSSPSFKKVRSNARQQERAKGKGFPAIKPGKIILATIVFGILGFLYLTHVFATQRLLQEVQQMENEYNKARQQYDELKLKYDRMVGPAKIYEKAKQQGFVNGGPDKVIIIKE